ncbi:MAG TPA: tetratricopeptide repeat protein [Bryobacteraceae bacterium]|nr:tetratricopeptide repeat protein [Bryobacteraceae bacterium]
MRRFLLALAVVAALCAAQETTLSVWRIEVRGGAPSGAGGEYTAELDTMQHQHVAAVSMRADGFFEFRDIAHGDYWLTISDGQGRTIYHGMVTAHSGSCQETVDLGPAQEKAGPGGPVSVAELRHPPSRKAIGAFVTSLQLAESGQFKAAAEELEKATRLSPDWPDAHTNLAAQYIRLGRFEDAVGEAKRSILLSKPNAVDLGNIAYAEFQLDRRREAIEAARAGLQADPNSAKLHYICGSLLAMDPHTLPEAVSHLEFAAKTFAIARKNLEQARLALRSSARTVSTDSH